MKKTIIFGVVALFLIGFVIAGGFLSSEITGYSASDLNKINSLGWNKITVGDTNCNADLLCRTTITIPQLPKPIGLYFYTTAKDEETILTARNLAIDKWVRERLPDDAKAIDTTIRGEEITLK